MATLQKIRNRGGLLVSIVIGLALVAFIVGDALSSGASMFNRKRNQIGEIAGEEISIQDYQNRLNENEALLRMMNNTSSLTSEQQEMLRENTWQQMIMEKILGSEYQELGINVSSEELYDMLLGDNMDPNVRQLFANPQTGEVDLDQARATIQSMINAPANTPQKAYWLNMEKEIADAREMAKFNTLILKSMFVTDAQADDNAQSGATVRDIDYIVRSYSSISDSTVNVSDSEIQKYYDKHQKNFEQEESRRIVYVNFEIAPSEKDFDETQEQVADLVTEFTETKEPKEFVELTSDVRFNPSYVTKSQIKNSELADKLFEGELVYGPYLEDGAYKISRIADRKMIPDSVRARHILIQMTVSPEATQHKADSLVALLKKGADFEKLARENSTDVNSAVNGGDLGWFTQEAMVQPFSDSAFFATKGEIKVVPTQFGLHILQVTERAKPVEKVQVATVVKEVIPSNETINHIYNNARTFATNLSTEEDFNKKAEEMQLNKRIATVRKNEKGIAGVEGSREIVRQAFIADETGKVLADDKETTIFEGNDVYTVGVLTGINEEGVTPLKQVSGQIKNILIRDKKAEILTKEYNEAKVGSQSLLSIAQKMGTDVKQSNEISFNSFQIPGAGIEPNLIGAINTFKQGEISTPVKGNQGVYMFAITSEKTEPVTPEMIESIKQRIQQMNAYSSTYQAMQALIKNGNVVDQRYKFY